jgi:lipoic acid synthetase
MSFEKVKSARRPHWLKIRLRGDPLSREVKELLQKEKLNTVCESANCPNIGDCWSHRTATFMILGNICTRNCKFCAVSSGKPGQIDYREPERIAKAIKILELGHAVITSVTRDDLSDGGSQHFVDTIQKVRELNPNCTVEVLIPDFQGNEQALYILFKEKPDILNHNLEVVPRLYPKARAQADFEMSLDILKEAKTHQLISKTGIMIGLGESKTEIVNLLHKLGSIDLDILTIGQYLQPSQEHLQVEKFYHPEEFEEFKKIGENLGIHHVESGPLVRSSYHANEQILKVRQKD